MQDTTQPVLLLASDATRTLDEQQGRADQLHQSLMDGFDLLKQAEMKFLIGFAPGHYHCQQQWRHQQLMMTKKQKRSQNRGLEAQHQWIQTDQHDLTGSHCSSQLLFPASQRSRPIVGHDGLSPSWATMPWQPIHPFHLPTIWANPTPTLYQTEQLK